MNKREIEKNVIGFCEDARQNLQFLERENIVTKKPEEVAATILQEASFLYPYDYLDSIYNDGIECVLEDMRKQTSSEITQLEEILMLGIALLLEYGLDEQEYRVWVSQQNNKIFSCILLGVVGEKMTAQDIERLRNQYNTERRGNLLAANAAGQFNKNTGIYFAASPVPNEEYQFKVFDQYLVYSKSFDDYDNAVLVLYKAINGGAEKMESCVEKTLSTSGAYGKKYPETLVEISEQLQESLQDIITELTRYMRSQKIEPEAIRRFRNDYTEIENGIKNYFLELLAAITRIFVKLFPYSQKYTHDYINNAIGRDRMRRVLMMTDVNGFEYTALQFGNDVLDDVLYTISNNAADAVINGMRMSSFEKKMKDALRELDFADLCYEGISTNLRHRLEDKYYEVLRVHDYALDEEEVPLDFKDVVYGSFFNNNNLAISKDELKHVLMNALVSYPYDSATVLGLMYLLFGDSAAEYDKIADYRGETDALEEFLSDDVEDAAESLLRKLPAEDLNSTKTSIDVITEFIVHHQKLENLQKLLAEYQIYQHDFELIETAKAKASQSKASVNAMIASAQDGKLIEVAEQGDGYAQYMLLKMFLYFGFDSHEFAWTESKSTYLSKYLRESVYWEKAADSRKQEMLPMFIDCAEHKIAGASTLVAEYLLRKGQLSEAKHFLQMAEENGDPQAFRNHAAYIRQGNKGFYKNLHIAEQLEKIASTLGVK